jgi:hypothetical protein
MADDDEEDPLPLRFDCSNTFWEEDSGVVLNSGLFHFTADINGRPAAVTIDNCSLPNLVSIEVVEKMQLRTYGKIKPYMLASYYHALPIMRTTHVPLTIYGHTVHIRCDVVPRALNFCHILLGKSWSSQFQVVFGSDHPDPSIFWNSKHTWLSYICIKEFQAVRRQNLHPPAALPIKPHVAPVFTPPDLCIPTMCTS